MPPKHPSFDVLLRGERSNDAVGVTEITVPSGWDGPPLHHHDFDEAFYVLDGQLTFQLDQTLTSAGSGELIFAARGERHTLANLSPTTARYLNICTPGAFTRYFDQLTAEPSDSNRSQEDSKPYPETIVVGPTIPERFGRAASPEPSPIGAAAGSAGPGDRSAVVSNEPSERSERSDYVQLGAVRTWFEERGEGEALVLVHPGGAGVDSRAWQPNLDGLASRFHLYTPDRRGHGRTHDVDGPITFDAMAGDTIAFLETMVGGPAHLVGCSDGATVALLVALRRPDLVVRLVLIAGVFHHDGWAPGVIEAGTEPPEFLERLYGEVSPDGPRHYPVIVAKLAEMHAREPSLVPGDLENVRPRTLVMVGDDDEVTLEHAAATYRGIPDSELMVVPGTSHGLLVEKPDLCNDAILTFLTTDPVPTRAPIRRAASR